jgi:serine/threonine protein kinase
MNGDQRSQLRELFHRAVALEPAARAAFLEEACGEDVALRRELDALLVAHEQAASVLAESPDVSLEAGRTKDVRAGERPADTGAQPDSRRTCPQCGVTYTGGQLVCFTDGEVLVKEASTLVGATLDGLYKIERLLGRGGMGAVYLARHIVLQDLVAVKVLSEDISSNPDWLRRFVREGQAARAIHHPNVVTVYDLRVSDTGTPYMVQEYIEGHNLRVELDRSGRLAPAHAVAILEPIASALDQSHAQGVVHRDLKPENVMLVRNRTGPHVKLLDLGIAKLREIVSTRKDALSALTLPGQVMGTPYYMPPEQWGDLPLDGNPEIDGRADVYSLAVVVYEVVSGSCPFDGETLHEVRRAHFLTTPRGLHEVVQGVPEGFGRAVTRALSKDRAWRQATAGEFIAELRASLRNAEAVDGRTLPPTEPAGLVGPSQLGAEARASGAIEAARPTAILPARQVALLYKRGARPDEELLAVLEEELWSRGYKVFVDRHLAVGVEWAREIERQVRASDAVIALLSAASVASEMLAYEVQVAREAALEQGRPRLLPIRVDYADPLPDPLAGYLDPIQYASWAGPQDTQALVGQVLDALRNPQSTRTPVDPERLEPVGGAVPLDSEYYVVRPADDEFRNAIRRGDSIVLVKGARQMGKTSLLARGLEQAREDGARVVLTDFQDLNAADLASAEKLFLTLGRFLAEGLDLDTPPKAVWDFDDTANRNFGSYMRREVLGSTDARVVWGLDEVDRLFSCDFASEVFGLFRAWHNRRSLDPRGPWKRLTLAIAYATEAHLFITDVNQSPFNVGTRVQLDDFTVGQVAELNRRYGSPLQDAGELDRYYALVGGHPYLVRRGLHEMAHGGDLAAFEAEADRDEGPLGDHLRRILVTLAKDPALCDVVRGVLRGEPCPTQESFYRLRSAGVMVGDSAQSVRPRCRVYETYLSRHLL